MLHMARWQTREDILRWEAQINIEAPLRREQFSFLLDMLAFDVAAPLRLLDVGAGGGALALCVLERLPQASIVLLDSSQAALELAAERLSSFGTRAACVLADLAESNWPTMLSGGFDAVVSSQVIHQFPDERKQALYTELVGTLGPGGWLLNLDHVAIPGPVLKEQYWRVRVEQIRRAVELEHHRPVSFDNVAQQVGRSREFSTKPYAPLAMQLEWLRALGLHGVDCFWKRGGLALFGGFRAEQPA